MKEISNCKTSVARTLRLSHHSCLSSPRQQTPWRIETLYVIIAEDLDHQDRQTAGPIFIGFHINTQQVFSERMSACLSSACLLCRLCAGVDLCKMSVKLLLVLRNCHWQLKCAKLLCYKVQKCVENQLGTSTTKSFIFQNWALLQTL